MEQRRNAVITGPIAGASVRMKMNDAPQIAASATSRAASTRRIISVGKGYPNRLICRGGKRAPRACGPTRLERQRNARSFQREQRALDVEPAGVTGERAVRADDAMARDHDAPRI